MIICKNGSDPKRNDEYGKDGFTACCPKDVKKIGSVKFFASRVGSLAGLNGLSL